MTPRKLRVLGNLGFYGIARKSGRCEEFVGSLTLQVVKSGVTDRSVNSAVAALQCFRRIILGRRALAAKTSLVLEPRKLPTVPGPE